MTDCVFCGIVAGDIPSSTVYENDQAVAFMDINPGSRGHLLVVPRRHATDLLAISPADLAACTEVAQTMARRAVDRLGATGVNLLNCCGADAWQTVMHFHWHVLPRYGDPAVGRDDLTLPFTPRPGDEGEIADAAALLSD